MYAKEQGRGAFTLEAHGKKATHVWGEISRDKLIDADLTNSFTVSAVISLGESIPVTVVARPSDDKEAFPAGTEVGFKFNGFTLANLSVGSGVELTLSI